MCDLLVQHAPCGNGVIVVLFGLQQMKRFKVVLLSEAVRVIS